MTFIQRSKLVHARLEREVLREQRSRWQDRTRLIQLKKLKLAIKDRLLRVAPPVAGQTAGQ